MSSAGGHHYIAAEALAEELESLAVVSVHGKGCFFGDQPVGRWHPVFHTKSFGMSGASAHQGIVKSRD